MLLPNWFLVSYLEKLIGSDFGRTGLAAHANSTKDEMYHIANEYQKLLEKVDITTPAIDFLNNYIPSKETGFPPITEGRKKLSLLKKKKNMRSAYLANKF